MPNTFFHTTSPSVYEVDLLQASAYWGCLNDRDTEAGIYQKASELWEPSPTENDSSLLSALKWK